ncbi:hypothetical protein Tco_0933734 [Tanacetum coccineum]
MVYSPNPYTAYSLPQYAVFDLWQNGENSISYVEGYIEDIVHDFEERLDIIFGREVNRVHVLDFARLIKEIRQALEKVTATDLFYLRSMDRGMENVPYLLALYLFRHAKGRKSGAKMSGDTLLGAWVASGPERQSAAAAGAPKDIEGLHVEDEGAQAVPAPVQAPQPPPAATPTRTMAQRLTD